jgi:hypothetical protein
VWGNSGAEPLFKRGTAMEKFWIGILVGLLVGGSLVSVLIGIISLIYDRIDNQENKELYSRWQGKLEANVNDINLQDTILRLEDCISEYVRIVKRLFDTIDRKPGTVNFEITDQYDFNKWAIELQKHNARMQEEP